MDERNANTDFGYPFGFAAPSDAPMFVLPEGVDWLQPLQPSPGQPVGYQPPSADTPPLENIAPAPEEHRDPAQPFDRFAAATDAAETPWSPKQPIATSGWDSLSESAAATSDQYADFAPPTGAPVTPAHTPVRQPIPAFPPPHPTTHTGAPESYAASAASIARATYPMGGASHPASYPAANYPAGYPTTPSQQPLPGVLPGWNPNQPQGAQQPYFPQLESSDQNLWQVIGWPFFVVLAIGVWFPELAIVALGVAFILSARITVGHTYVRKLFAYLIMAGFAVWVVNQAIWAGALDWDLNLPPLLFRGLCLTALVGTPIAVNLARQRPVG
ncbi:MAG: hypothetical protein LBC29_03380 [Propionibacteriaceae bacterium]|jgi:hypothetical protein|nr:hypothetical protein [Propionibacteriaceae bacterium]